MERFCPGMSVFIIDDRLPGTDLERPRPHVDHAKHAIGRLTQSEVPRSGYRFCFISF